MPITANSTTPSIVSDDIAITAPAADTVVSTEASTIVTKNADIHGRNRLLRSTKYAIAINPAIANTASNPGTSNPGIFFFSPPVFFN